MSRSCPLLGAVMTWTLIVVLALTGCHPQQPFYFGEDGDLSHYLDVATEIDYPDVQECPLDDVKGAIRPFSLENRDPEKIWDLPLEEAIHIALSNGKVLRSGVAGLASSKGDTRRSSSRMPDQILRFVSSPGAVQTVYDPAITETNPRFGTEAALSAFDAQLSTSVFWEKNDSPRNPLVFPGSEDVFPRKAKEDLGSFQAQLRKTAATGGTWLLTHNVNYSKQNTSRLFTSDWNVNLEAEFRQPLFQGAGVQYNRIAGPGAIPGFNNGVMIARINTDIQLADFEAGVRNLVAEVEAAYWKLYFAYRSLDALVAGRDAGLQTWRQIYTKLIVGTAGAHEEAQARNQYWLFVAAMQQSLNELYGAEANLRYLMGLAATDGRLIRPMDEPTTAKVTFDWYDTLCEALARSVELRQQKWNVKRRELELISAKNWLLPRLDAVGRYRWLGLGDDLANLNNNGPGAFEFDNAYGNLSDGNFQEWHFGLELTIPIGFRKEMSGVRHAQLNLARERAVLQEMELELSHQLAWAIREMEGALRVTQTNFNRRIAAQAEVETAEAKYEASVAEGTLDRVLDAQRRRAEAESDYYASLVDYNQLIAQVHFRKGSLLEYNGIYLAEGPWPAKAYFDALRRARARDAGLYLDYGFTLPRVISRGAYQQHTRPGAAPVPWGEEIESGEFGEGILETVPTPTPIPAPAERPVEPPAAEPSPEPKPSPPSGKGKTARSAAVARPAAGQTAGRGVKEKAYDLGRMNLEPLAAPAGNPLTAADRSTVEKATQQDRGEDRGSDPPKRPEVSASYSKWTRSNRPGTRHESVANPPVAASDWPAPGGQGVQR